MQIPRLLPKKLGGSERFWIEGRTTDWRVQEFWQWSTSDLVSNATRGRLAEFIVAKAMGISTDTVRDEWAAYDLTTPEGIKIEVKSAAYLQSWAQNKPSSITFRVRPARAWDPETNRQAPEPCRTADVYVFALLAHQDKISVDPLNLDQWEFYVLSTRAINERKRSQHSITLNSLRRLHSGPVSFGKLRTAVLRTFDSG